MGPVFKLPIKGEKAFREVLLTKKKLVVCGAKPRVTAGDATTNSLFLDGVPTFAEANVMGLLDGMPRAPPSANPDATPEQILHAFLFELISAETHYLTTDSEATRRRQIPTAAFLMLTFPQACKFFDVTSERTYWITECICEWDQLTESEWDPNDNMVDFPNFHEWLPEDVDTGIVDRLVESKSIFDD